MEFQNLHKLMIKPGIIHIWKADLNLNASTLSYLYQTLSAQEKARSEHFYHPKDRKTYIAARGLLRRLISNYVECEPSEIVYEIGDYGKPFLNNSANLHFNLSYSKGHVIFGFSRNRSIGVDLEHLQPESQVESVKKRVFNAYELSQIQNLPTNKRSEAFFLGWTRKEAILKATGEGLNIPPNKVVVNVDPDDTPELIDGPWNKQEHPNLSLYSFYPYDGFIGSVAVDGPMERVEFMPPRIRKENQIVMV